MREFVGYPKIYRLNRDMILTEKIDGTNASITIVEDGEILAGSKNRFLTVDEDNYGFARWVEDHREELLGLGMGIHFGEWWGKSINRGYLAEKRTFSLFNVNKWCRHDDIPIEIPTLDPKVTRIQKRAPECCDVVPVLYRGPFSVSKANEIMASLKYTGSWARPGYMNPEGIVVFHTANGAMFKATLGGDGAKTKRA